MAPVVIPGYDGLVKDKALLSMNQGKPKLGDIVTDIIPHLFVFAGILMMLMVLWGGIHLMIAGGDPEGIKEGRAKITWGLVGFLVVFASYFIVQIVSAIFHISIL